MLSKEEIEKAIIWVKERIEYITQNCDLKDEDNKGALENLKIINICLQENNKQNKIIDLMSSSINSYDSQLNICYFKDKEHVKQHYEQYFKQYFERNAEEHE